MPKQNSRRPPKRVIVVSPFAPAIGTHGGAAQIFNVWNAFRKAYPRIAVKMLCASINEEYSPSTLAHSRRLKAQVFPPEDNSGKSGQLPAMLPKSWGAYSNSRLLDAVRKAQKSWPDAIVVVEMSLALHYLDALADQTKVALIVHEALARRFMQEWRLAESRGDPTAREKEDLFHEVFRYESHYLPRVSRALCLSAEDAEYVRVALGSARVGTIPLCIPVESIRNRVKGIRSEPETICFWGSFIHPPNIHAVEFLLEEAWPLVLKYRPSAKLRIYGSFLSPELRLKWAAHTGVEVVGQVKDIYRAVSRNSIATVPVVTGHGVRTKFLESLAMRRPVVTTRLGAEGLPVKHSVSCLIADKGDALAKCFVRLLKDSRLRNCIAREGYKIALQHDARRSAAALHETLTDLNSASG